MKNLFNRVILILFFLLVFVTPMLFTKFTNEIYEFPKMYFVYTIGVTLIFAFICRLIFFVDLKTSALIFPEKKVMAYLLMIVVSVMFSSHPYTSLWGYYSRFNGGLISYLILFGIYLVGLNFFRKETIVVLKDISVLTMFPISIYGIIQSFDHDRVFSTFGQPNWLGAYFIMFMPLVLEKFFRSKKIIHKIIWAALYILSLACLFFTGSLSGIAGLAASFVWLLVRASFRFNKKYLLLILLILPIVYFFSPSFIKNRISDAFVISSDPHDYKVSDPGLIRYGLWKGSLAMIFSSPKNFFLGTGPETFPYNFPFYREDVLNYSSEWNFILNKPHNYYLEIWSESGIFALILYLILAWQILKSKDIYISSGMAGVLVANFFGWPSVYVSLIFWIWLAYIHKERKTQL